MAEIAFAQKLASNEKPLRTRALKKLRNYLEIKSKNGEDNGLSDNDMIKIWKGLWYCMYMSDKMLIQEELAEHIASLIHNLQNSKDKQCFTKAAFLTFGREWNGIDTFRLDKYMMFMRRLLRQILEYLKSKEWDVKEVLTFSKILETTILCPDDHSHSTPLGLKLHFCDIFLEELAKVSHGVLINEVMLAFLAPFMKVLILTRDKIYFERIRSQIFHHLIRQSDVGLDYQGEEFIAEGEIEDDIYAENEGEEEAEEEPEGEPEEENPDDDVEDISEEIDVEKPEVDEGQDEEMGTEEPMEEEKGMTEDEDEVLDPRAGNVHANLPQLQVDFDAIGTALQKLASINTLPNNVRKKVFALVDQLKDVAGGIYPLNVPTVPTDNPRVTKKDINNAVERLQSEFSKSTEELAATLPKYQSKNVSKKIKKRMKKKEKLRLKKAKTDKQEVNEKSSEKSIFSEETKKQELEDKLKEISDSVPIEHIQYTKTEKVIESNSTKKKDKKKSDKGKKAATLETNESNGSLSNSIKRKSEDAGNVQAKKKSKKSKVESNDEINKDSNTENNSKKQSKLEKKMVKNISTLAKKPKTMKNMQKSKKVSKEISISPKPIDDKVEKSTEEMEMPKTSSKSKKSINVAKNKSIKIKLGNNTEQEYSDYLKDLKNSPTVPYSANKKPKAPALKTTHSPILVKKINKKKLSLIEKKEQKHKRSTAADFF